jgi:hypothetical protein
VIVPSRIVPQSCDHTVNGLRENCDHTVNGLRENCDRTVNTQLISCCTAKSKNRGTIGYRILRVAGITE